MLEFTTLDGLECGSTLEVAEKAVPFIDSSGAHLWIKIPKAAVELLEFFAWWILFINPLPKSGQRNGWSI